MLYENVQEKLYKKTNHDDYIYFVTEDNLCQ